MILQRTIRALKQELFYCNQFSTKLFHLFKKYFPMDTKAMHLTTLKVNGRDYHLELLPWTSLLDTLREEIHLTGTKKGCDHGQCGACTVIVDGKRILSCLTLSVMKDGSEITTIEGIADGENLHPLQKAFIECDAFQCGYCTPGQICSAVGMLKEGKANTREEVQELMSGNLCRCGANKGIIDAIMQVKEGGSHE
jgi:xanthine dehydrogenase YagT iron-sulfur-binding subunit